MFDVDHFKRVNDVYGHDAGDQALVAVAGTIANGVRLVGRLGGEEFAILLEGQHLGDGVALAERLRASIAALRLETAGGALTLTCSFGVSERHAGETIDDLLKRADVALYAAKTGGRNRVVAADAVVTPFSAATWCTRSPDSVRIEPSSPRRRLRSLRGVSSMRRYLVPGLIALVASTIYVQASTPTAPQAQPLRKLEFSRIGPWEVAAIGNDEKVNHCALTRGTSSTDLKPGEPKCFHGRRHQVDDRARARRELQVHREEGACRDRHHGGRRESTPLAATGGPDLADIRFSAEPQERDALLATRHLDIRMDEGTVRLSFAGLGEAKRDLDQCMANIGTPAKGWSNAEIDQLIKQVKRGKAEVHREQAHARHDVRCGLSGA